MSSAANLTEHFGSASSYELIQEAENSHTRIRNASRDWPSLTVQGESLAVLELMLRGALPSQCGFMTQKDFESVRSAGISSGGVPWLSPLVLPLPQKLVSIVQQGSYLALRDAEGVMLAALQVEEVWSQPLTLDGPNHSGNSAFVAGQVMIVQQPACYSFHQYRQTVEELEQALNESRTECVHVIAFLAVRPIHRSLFEDLMRTAQQTGSQLLIIGAIPPDLQGCHMYSTVRCWVHAINESAKVMHLSLWPIPAPLTTSGLFLAAQIARCCGCELLLAETFAQDVLDKVSPAARLTIRNVTPERIRKAEEFDSHTEVVTYLRAGHPVPEFLTFPRVLRELSSVYRSPAHQGVTVFFTGLSGSGKSTIANALHEALLARGGRAVTLLDGDVVRHHLSSELGFTREDRELNVTRIGFVAMEVVKHGGIAICAPIAPYEKLRTRVRRMIEQFGIFLLVYVSTPLEVCEQRDRKGLYARARHGLIENFTGISDVYETPADADLVIDTSRSTPCESANLILSSLAALGCLQSP